MYRAPVRSQRSPGPPRPAGRFPSPAPGWAFPGPRSPFPASGHHGSSPRPYAPRSPGFSPGSNRGYGNRSPGGFGSGSRDFAGPMWRRGDGQRRSFSPSSAPNFQSRRSDPPVDRFFSPSMMEDPWKTLQPITAEDASTARRTT